MPPPLDVRDDAAATLAGIEPEHLVVLAGAGISLPPPSGLPIASQFLRTFFETCLPATCDPALFLAGANALAPGEPGLRFEVVLGLVQQRFDPELRILDVFRGGRPNHNHHCLSALAHRGALVVTTNFDGLLEAAMPEGAAYRVRATEADFEEPADAAGRLAPHPEFWHLHGVLRDPRTGEDRSDTIVSTVRHCWETRERFRLDVPRGGALARALAERDLLVVGYSGSDDFDIAPALEAAPSSRRVVWLHHAAPPAAAGGLLRRLVSWRRRTHDTRGAFVGDGITPLVTDFLPDGTCWYRAPAANTLATMVAEGTRAAGSACLLRHDTGAALACLARIAPPPVSGPRVDLGAHFRAWRDQHLPDELSRGVLAILLCHAAGRHEERRRLLRETIGAVPRSMPPGTAAAGAQPGLLRAFVEVMFMAVEEGLLDPAVLEAQGEFGALAREDAGIRATWLTARARAHQAAGQTEEAMEGYRASLEARQHAEFLQDVEVAEYDLAAALFAQGYARRDLRAAEAQAQRALAASVAVSRPEGIARASLLLGRIAERLGRHSEAETRYQQACDAAFRSGMDALVAVSHGEYGLFLWEAAGKGGVEILAGMLRQPETGLHEDSDAVLAALQACWIAMPPEAREVARRAAGLLAEAFRIHERQRDWEALKLVASNLADCLELLGERARALLAHCAVYRCAVACEDGDTALTALERIRASASRELRELPLASLSAKPLVDAVQKELLDREVRI